MSQVFKIFGILMVCFVPLACNDNNSEAPNTSNPSFGNVKSLDLGVINLEDNFNKWGMIERGSSVLEILLEIKDDTFNNPTPSRWSLNIRTLPDPNGLKDIADLDVRLFTNYLSECCANSNDVVGRTETYDQVYVAVAGSIDFNTSNEGVVDLFFQKEDQARTNNTSGAIVNVKACWKIAPEGGMSGCELS